jgi:hypothetical protein
MNILLFDSVKGVQFVVNFIKTNFAEFYNKNSDLFFHNFYKQGSARDLKILVLSIGRLV